MVLEFAGHEGADDCRLARSLEFEVHIPLTRPRWQQQRRPERIVRWLQEHVDGRRREYPQVVCRAKKSCASNSGAKKWALTC